MKKKQITSELTNCYFVCFYACLKHPLRANFCRAFFFLSFFVFECCNIPKRRKIHTKNTGIKTNSFSPTFRRKDKSSWAAYVGLYWLMWRCVFEHLLNFSPQRASDKGKGGPLLSLSLLAAAVSLCLSPSCLLLCVQVWSADAPTTARNFWLEIHFRSEEEKRRKAESHSPAGRLAGCALPWAVEGGAEKSLLRAHQALCCGVPLCLHVW